MSSPLLGGHFTVGASGRRPPRPQQGWALPAPIGNRPSRRHTPSLPRAGDAQGVLPAPERADLGSQSGHTHPCPPWRQQTWPFLVTPATKLHNLTLKIARCTAPLSALIPIRWNREPWAGPGCGGPARGPCSAHCWGRALLLGSPLSQQCTRSGGQGSSVPPLPLSCPCQGAALLTQ